MRDVQIIDPDSRTTRAHHVIGIDESGNVTAGGPSTLTAVRCPRENGELLAELLIDNGLHPWHAKSQQLKAKTSLEEYNRRVESFIEDLEDSPIEWRTAFGYQQATIHQKAAAACALAKKTITANMDYGGDAVLLPDGATSMYGDQQRHLRLQAAQFFDGAFESAFGSVYTTGLPDADLTYPEVTAADYLSGYIRDQIATRDISVGDISGDVIWFTEDWREPGNISPASFYTLKPATGHYGTPKQSRVVAWVKGRHPEGEDHDVSSQLRNSVEMLESEQVQQYLLTRLLPQDTDVNRT